VLPVFPDGSQHRAQLVFFVADPAERPAAHWRAAVAEHIADHERPNRVVVLPEFPLNRTGKVDRQSLQRLAESAVARDGKKGEMQ
jgi:acyl-coenzyme A synthetase/AMP-(fatty) acid ligase